MKKTILLAALLIVTTVLTACGSKDDTNAQMGASAQQASIGAQAEAAVAETPLLTCGAVAEQIGAQSDLQEAVATAAAELTSVTSAEERPVDLDLTKLSGTVVYSQVYDMMMNPDRVAKVIRFLRGFRWLSGTSSATTTLTMAPAAKLNKNGSKYLIFNTSSAPITPAIGSTIPLNCP